MVNCRSSNCDRSVGPIVDLHEVVGPGTVYSLIPINTVYQRVMLKQPLNLSWRLRRGLEPYKSWLFGLLSSLVPHSLRL